MIIKQKVKVARDITSHTISVRFKRVITPMADGVVGKDITIYCWRKYELF